MIVEPWAAGLLLLALLIDRFVIDPDRLWRRVPHPVVGFGWLIDRGEALARRAGRRWERTGGVAIVVVLLAVSAAVGSALVAVPWLGPILSAAGAAALLAQRSLDAHVERVADGLDHGLSEGRAEVAMIVGRDVSALDEAGVSRAAIESLAENFSDGVVAPAFWYLVFGLPGILAYKAINTADSMIGHRNERHERVGWAAARLDDLLNIVPARFTAFLIAAISASPARVVRCAWRDAGLHRSPNAGWPEAAMAGALGVSLGGPRAYGGVAVTEPAMNPEGRRELSAADIRRALRLYRRALWLLLALVALGALAFGTSDEVQNVLHHA